MYAIQHHRPHSLRRPVRRFHARGTRGVALRVACFIVMVTAPQGSAVGAAFHPFHVSVAEATMNTKSGRLEVALRVFPDDLEDALSLRARRPIRLEKTEGIDDLILAYLKEVFTVRPAPPKKKPKRLAPPEPTPKPKVKVGEVHWVGKEVQVQAAWLYFEISLPSGIHHMEFSNRVFFESHVRQINTMTIQEGAFKTSVQFTVDAPTKVIVIPNRP